MGTRHWSDEEILADLYGVGPMAGSLDECADCLRRRQSMRRRQEELRAAAAEPSETFFAAQRQAVMARVAYRPRFSSWQLVPGLAAVVLLVLAIFFNRPLPTVRPAPEASDAQLLEDVFSIVARSEPAPVEPVRGLFQVKQ